MTKEEMRDLILGKVPTHFVTCQELWALCGSPQHPDNALFDEVLIVLARENELRLGVAPGRYPLNTYASK